MTKKTLHVDNQYLVKKLDEGYQQAFQRLYDYLLKDTRKSDFDKSIILNIAIEDCMEGMKTKKKPNLIIPKDVKEYVIKHSKGMTYKQMKEKLRNQDYEKIEIGSIWLVFAVSIVLFFIKNLIIEKYLINLWIDSLVACIAFVIVFQNIKIKYRIIERYKFGNLYKKIDIITILACIVIKLVTSSNFDITYLLLVIHFFITKKKMKPQFEDVI